MGVEAWGGTGDWGCDAFFAGELTYPNQQSMPGPFVFQAKFVISANAAGAKPEKALLSAVDRECNRISARLTAKNQKLLAKWPIPPLHYALLTNAVINPLLRTKIETKIKTVLPCAAVHCHGGTDLCAWIAQKPALITAFPQLLTITDWPQFLNSIVHSGIFARSESLLMLAEQAARAFVPTKAYYEAQETLRKHHFVVLEGPPEMGKTTIGRMIAVAQAAQKWEAIECRTPKELLEIFDATRPQVFIADDFFGRGEYEPTRMSEWQSELPHILFRLDKKHWLILTSRAHILNIGKAQLDVSGQNHRFPQIGEVLVDAGKLTELEKGKILYRHAKTAGLTATIRHQLKLQATSIVRNKHFTPLRIRNFIQALKDQYLEDHEA